MRKLDLTPIDHWFSMGTDEQKNFVLMVFRKGDGLEEYNISLLIEDGRIIVLKEKETNVEVRDYPKEIKKPR